jgi:1,3-beta-glucan synthase
MSTATWSGPTGYADPYPAWSGDKQIPISYEEIEDIFLDLTQKFGFQRDSMRNQVRLYPEALDPLLTFHSSSIS